MSIKKSTLLVSSFILLGRITGLFREWLLSSVEGANEKTDIAIIAFTFPDLIINLVLGGGLAATLIPALNKENSANKKELAQQLGFLVFIIFTVLVLIFSINLTPILKILGPGISDIALRKATPSFIFVLISIPISAISGVLSAYLNSNLKFAIAASGTIFINLGIIIGLASKLPLLWGVSIGILLGTLLRFSIQNMSSRLYDLFHIFKSLNFLKSKNLITKSLLKKFTLNFSFVSVLIFIPIMGRSWASTLGEGSLTIFNYSFKLIELPMGIIIGSLNTVLLSNLSINSSRSHIFKTVKYVFFLSLMISIPAIIFAPLLINIVYFKNTLNPFQIEQLIFITRFGFLFLIGQALTSTLGTILAAIEKQNILLPIGLFMLIIINLFCLLNQDLSMAYLIFSIGITYIISSLLLLIYLAKVTRIKNPKLV